MNNVQSSHIFILQIFLNSVIGFTERECFLKILKWKICEILLYIILIISLSINRFLYLSFLLSASSMLVFIKCSLLHPYQYKFHPNLSNISEDVRVQTYRQDKNLKKYIDLYFISVFTSIYYFIIVKMSY